jgi:hypothetical protein
MLQIRFMSLRQWSGPFVEIWIGDYFLAEVRLGSFALRPENSDRRTNFCRWLRLLVENPAFLDHILFTDECIMVDNPFLTRSRQTQHRFSINVWADILGQRFVGPFILPNRLNGNLYLELLHSTHCN